MENSVAYKWVATIFFGIVGVMFTASIVYLAAGNVAPDTFFGRKMTLGPIVDRKIARRERPRRLSAAFLILIFFLFY